MPPHPFRLPTTEFSSSIVMDASTVGETTVTVAVSATREAEPTILAEFYNHGRQIDFKPFYEKANNFEHEDQRQFCEDVIRTQASRLVAFAHRRGQDGNANTQQIEAVHSAIHVDRLLTARDDDPLVIVDGNEQKATPFVKALSGLRTDLPPVAHCLQSEIYYPTALLADIASNYLANSFERGHFDQEDPLLPAPRAKVDRATEWGQAFSAMYRNGIEYTPPELHSMRGESVRERICCWYEGAVASDGSAERPLSDSLNPVVRALRRDGFDELADTLSQL